MVPRRLMTLRADWHGEMTDAFSSMEYPHWLIVAGVVLLVLGFMGLALRRRVAQAELKEVASGGEQVRSDSKSEPAQTHSAEGKATPEVKEGSMG
jgi:Sec-independent protein translocase protein TatA